MQPETILKSDVLDILFENRNKEYGAYTLRREYDARLGKAIAITFSLAALLLLLSYSFKDKIKKTITMDVGGIVIINPPPKLPKKTTDLPKKKTGILPKKPSPAPVAAVAYTKPVVVADNLASNNIPTVDNLLKKNISTVNANGLATTGLQNLSTTINAGNGKGDGGEQVQGDDVPTDRPDVYPDFPGGRTALLNFLRKNLNNPKDLEEEMVSVKVRFVVNVDGSISGFDVIESGGTDFDNEVLRVLKKMPHWIPGKSNGHSVSVYYEVPVKFVAAGG